MKQEHIFLVAGIALGLYLAANSPSGAKMSATLGGYLPKLPV